MQKAANDMAESGEAFTARIQSANGKVARGMAACKQQVTSGKQQDRKRQSVSVIVPSSTRKSVSGKAVSGNVANVASSKAEGNKRQDGNRKAAKHHSSRQKFQHVGWV